MISSFTYGNYGLFKQQRLECYLETTIGRRINALCKSRSCLKNCKSSRNKMLTSRVLVLNVICVKACSYLNNYPVLVRCCQLHHRNPKNPNCAQWQNLPLGSGKKDKSTRSLFILRECNSTIRPDTFL